MLNIGSHISSSKGYYAMGKQAVKLGANTFAFLPVIQEAEKQRKLMKRMLLNIWSFPKNRILPK